MKSRIEEIISVIFSRKYDAKIRIKFVNKEDRGDASSNKTRTIKEKSILDK